MALKGWEPGYVIPSGRGKEAWAPFLTASGSIPGSPERMPSPRRQAGLGCVWARLPVLRTWDGVRTAPERHQCLGSLLRQPCLPSGSSAIARVSLSPSPGRQGLLQRLGHACECSPGSAWLVRSSNRSAPGVLGWGFARLPLPPTLLPARTHALPCLGRGRGLGTQLPLLQQRKAGRVPRPGFPGRLGVAGLPTEPTLRWATARGLCGWS